jgi:hypothetical protein
MKTLFIRIHPHQPQRGFRSARLSIYGYLFQEKLGWYRATFNDSQWAYLRNMRNDESNPDSPRVFQIVDEAGKRALEEEERREKIQALSQSHDSIVDLTTHDLRGDAPTVRVERARATRAVDYDQAAEARTAQPVPDETKWSVDLAAPGQAASVQTSEATASRRGRGRPRTRTSVENA